MPLPLRTLQRSGALGIPNRAFGRGGRGGSTVPIMEALVEVPHLMVGPKSRIRRVHTRAVKKGLHKEMLFHHRRRIPEHFNRFRQKKYRYAERSERTRAIKQKRNQADLVKTGKTKREMTRSIRIRFPRVGPDAVAIEGRLRWPPGFRRFGAATRGITPEVMSDEISRFTLREERTIAQHVTDTYTNEINSNLSRRAKIKIRGQLGRLGIRV